jgi:hypothetical protein
MKKMVFTFPNMHVSATSVHNQAPKIKILEKITRIYSKFVLRTRYVLSNGSTIVPFN